jgi:hypothetical protein
MERVVFWDITQCSHLKISRRFERTCQLHLQAQGISEARNQLETSRNQVKSHAESMCLCTKRNSVPLVRERTIPTERPPLVDEIIANFCG